MNDVNKTNLGTSDKRRCVIISGGDFDTSADIVPGDFVIACDKGYTYAERLGIRPDLVIGDFDSCTGKVKEGIPVRRLPCEKDDTDTMSAVRYAVGSGFEEIVLCCALGGRADHAYSNYQAGVFAVTNGAAFTITSDDTRISFLCSGETDIP